MKPALKAIFPASLVECIEAQRADQAAYYETRQKISSSAESSRPDLSASARATELLTRIRAREKRLLAMLSLELGVTLQGPQS